MEAERRAAPRARVLLFANEYIDGVPCLCELVEMSNTGALVRRLLGPSTERAIYALEIGRSGAWSRGDRFWLAATPVWRDGEHEAVAFVGASPGLRAKLSAFLADAC